MPSLVMALLIEDLDSAFGVIEKADAYAGISSGGLIALALADGVPIGNIIHVYQSMGPSIFTVNSNEKTSLTQSERNSIKGVTTTSDHLSLKETTIDGLKLIASKFFDDGVMSGLNKLTLVGGAKVIDRNYPDNREIIFSNVPDNPYASMALQDVALASSSLFSRYYPYRVENYGEFSSSHMVSGAVEKAAIAEALELDHVVNENAIAMLSISVDGFLSNSYSKQTYAPANAHKACGSVEKAAPAKLNHHYCRGAMRLPHGFEINDWNNISNLMAITYDYMASMEWAQIKKWVSSHW